MAANQFAELIPRHDFLVFVADPVAEEHFRAFWPPLAAAWGLPGDDGARWQTLARESAALGVSRFGALSVLLSEYEAAGRRVVGLDALCAWAENAPALTDTVLADAAERTIDAPGRAILDRTLRWSRAGEAATPLRGAMAVLDDALTFADVRWTPDPAAPLPAGYDPRRVLVLGGPAAAAAAQRAGAHSLPLPADPAQWEALRAPLDRLLAGTL